MILNVEKLYKYFNGEAILKDINMTVENHEIIGLIGNNGCGKTTLLNIIAGEESFDNPPDNSSAAVNISNKATIGFLKQNSGLDTDNTIYNEMKNAFADLNDTLEKMKKYEKMMTVSTGAELERINHEYSELVAFYEARDGYNTEFKIQKILNGMGFADTPKDRIIHTLSGGEKTRLALAKLLLENPDLLILDEPTNHLDFKTLMWLEDYLKGYKGSVIIVSHDRYFLNKVCSRICEIERCRLTSYKGDYSAYLVQKKMNSERTLKEYEAQQKEISKLEDYIVRNKTRASTANMAKSRQHALDKIERIEKPLMFTKPPKIKLSYTIEPTKDIVKVIDCPLKVGSGANKKTLINNLNFNVRRGEHVAIIGENGIGKTSVLKLIQGFIPHESGNIVWGGNVKISYFDQEHAQLNRHNTVIDELCHKHPHLSPAEARNSLGSVLISGEDVFKPVSVLSGGERAKLCFAIMANNNGNVLILDEPTNHLDMNTKEVLEDALAEFEGTIILVSHDRYLLNKVATRIVEITKDNTESFEGNFDDYYSVISEREAAALAIENENKKIQKMEEYKENKQKAYRSKEQRASDAKKRQRIKELETEIEKSEELISTLEAEISQPEITNDFQLMTEKCNLLEQTKNELDEKMEEWAELSDSL